MGQFSYVCAVCDQEILHGSMPGYQKFTLAYVFFPNGDRTSGEYDGYGRLGHANLVEQMGEFKVVHQCCYTNQPYDTMTTGKGHARDQGWWPGERIAIERYGEPNMKELTKEATYVCYECKRTWKDTWSGGLCPFGCVRPKNYRDPALVIEKDWGDHNEMVEPLHYLDYRYEVADGVIVCRNETQEHPNWKLFHEKKMGRDEDPPTMIEPCFRFDEPQQARITKPEEWDEFDSEEKGEFVVKCRSCKTTDVEIVPLTASVNPKHAEPSSEPGEELL